MAVGEPDAFVQPVRYGSVDEVVGHAAVSPYHPPPRQIGLLLRGHGVADDSRRGAEELGDVAVRDDAAGRYDPHHGHDVVSQTHWGSAPTATTYDASYSGSTIHPRTTSPAFSSATMTA